MRLLLAEDDDKLRKELGKFFSMHGYETEEITDYEHMEAVSYTHLTLPTKLEV